MTARQKLELKRSELRKKLAELAGLPEPTAEQLTEIETRSKEFQSVETQWQALVLSEGDDKGNLETREEPEDSEGKEIRELRGKVSLSGYIAEALEQRSAEPVDEYRAAVLGDEGNVPGKVPWEMLLPPDPEPLETRAVTPVADSAVSAGTRASVLERVFTRSVAARLDVDVPSVAVGEAVYPVMLSGTTASMQAPDGEQTAVAGSFEGHTLGPIRLTGSYEYRVEDAARMPALEDTLRRDLAAVMTDSMDDQVINGNGNAPNVNGFLSELTAPSDPDSNTWRDILSLFTDKVDGLNAYTLSDLRAVMGKDTYGFVAKLFGTATEGLPRQSIDEYLRAQTGGNMSVSSRIPAKDSTTNVQTNIMALTSYPGRNAVAPMWEGFDLIRDPYTKAKSGVIGLTAVALWNFKILRETGYSLFKVKTG